MANRVPAHVRWQILYLVGAFIIHGMVVYWAITQQKEQLSSENGWLENLQVLYLALAAVGFALSGSVLTDRHRLLFYFLSMLALLFIIREVEFGDLAIPQWMKFMLAGAGRAVFYVVAIVLFIKQAGAFREYWHRRKMYLRMSIFWYLMASGFFLVAFSLTFDRQFIEINHYQLLEEASETIAYLLLLGAAVFGYVGVRKNFPLQGEKKSLGNMVEGTDKMESLFPFLGRFLQTHKQNR